MARPGFDRRRFLQLLAGSSAGLVVPSTLAGCGDGGRSTPDRVGAPASTAPSTTLAPEPAGPWWMQGGFAPVAEEVTDTDLEVTGALPPELDGLYVRNGSNPAAGPSPHWFLGDGMVHGIRLEAGRASWYRNRWVRTPLRETGASFGEAPPGGATTLANVSVIHHGGRLLALGEVGFPYELATSDLETVGPFDHAGRLTTSMTAHPKVDPATGALHGFGYGFGPPFLTYHVIDAAGALTASHDVAVGGPTMIHDFAITERHVVFWELPVVFDLDAAIAGDDMPFRWDPGYGARLGTFALGGPASGAAWVEIEPCYVFHGVNAWDEGDDVVIDVCRHPSMFESSTTRLGGEGGDLRRWRARGDGSFAEEILEGDRELELPTIDRRVTGRPSRQAWFIEAEAHEGSIDFTGIVRRDGRTGELDTWSMRDGWGAGEATFVPGSPSAAEGEGWVVALISDPGRERSELAVLEAGDLAGGPVARVHLPVRVPFGFHGTWVPAEDLGT